LSLVGNGQGDSDGLPEGHHYLGVPAPRRIAAQHALHLLRSSPFSESQKRTARIAADWIGAWATGAGAVMSRPVNEPQATSLEPAPEVGGVAIEQLLSDAMRAAAETLSADTCSLMVMDEARGTLVVDTAYGLAEGIVRDPGRRPGEGIASYVMSLGQPVILNDPLHDPRLHGIAIEPRPHIKCSICVPIELRQGLRGVVSFNRTENAEPFTQDDLRLACTVASQLGPCVANARLYQQAAARLGEMTAISQHLREDVDDFYRLYNSVQRLNTSLAPQDVLKQTAHEVRLLTGCRRAAFAPLSPALGPLSVSQERGLSLLRMAPESAAMRGGQSITAPLLVTPEREAATPEMADLASQVRRLTGGDRALIIPLAHEQGSLGLIVGWRFSREPREREISLAAGLCAHGAALLRKAIDYEAAINKRSLELSALYRLCEEISAATSFEAALRSVLEIAHSMVDCDEGLVFIWSAESGRLELAASRGVDFEAIKEQAPQAQPGNMYQWVFTEGKAFISTDIGQLGGDGSPGGQVLRSAMAVPLVVGNAAIGVLAIHSARPRAYTEEHVKVLSIVASQAAAIYRALQSLGSLSRYTDNILQSIVAGVIGLDRAGRIVIWSPAAERIFNRSAPDAVGADLLSLAREIGREQGSCVGRAVESLALVARRVLANGEPVLEQELRLERDGAPPHTLLAECTPLRGGDAELVGAVLLVEDITERKRMQDRMRQMSQLAAVGHLAANVAHEIRNPLSAIKAAAQFLSTEYGGDGLIAQFAGIINQECDRLGKVATDFLTYARPNEPALERISPAAVVEDALAATAAEMAQRSIAVNWRAPRALPKVWGDPEALRQVFVNLLLNAAQAIGSDGEITITLRATGAGAEGRALEAVVSDTGPGIPEENMERIWTPFFSTRAKGTGLGLSIVRKTVESHGGQVWAEGGRSGGASFRIRLPLDGGARARQAGACAPVSTGGGRQWRQLDLFGGYFAQSKNEGAVTRAAR
jgi:PAS domain S-box-containing protein